MPLDKVGVASGIYKMASSLGGAFGVAISGAVYAVQLLQRAFLGCDDCTLVNVLMGIMAFIAILFAILMMINVSKMRNNNDDLHASV